MTLFSFEVPLAHQQEFEEFQDYTFALNFLMYASTDYLEYVRAKCKESGAYVIIDNSFNETNIPIAVQEMARIYEEFNPSLVIAPDADWWSTQYLVGAWSELASYVGPQRAMGIFRTTPEKQLLDRRGCSHYATSYWFRQNTTPDALTPDTHFLGLGDLADVRKYLPRTLDTSIPIKMALRGESLLGWAAEGGKYTRHYTREAWGPARFERAWKYFQTEMTPEQLELAKANIRDLRWLVNGSAES